MADPMQDATQDPTAAAPADDQSSQGGFCIELRVTADGKMSVGVESLADEQQEEGGEGGADEQGEYQPVGSLPEAFRLIKEIVAHGGEPTDAGASQDAMSAGYGPSGS